MGVNTQQLLADVVARPKLSAVDAKHMGAIWGAFTAHLTEQLHARKPVRCLDLGEFVMRHDTIGAMEFFNPMFVMAEEFAARHKLLDRRPKAAALGSATGRPADVDLARVTQMASAALGELVPRETVEAALKDVVERIGECCADERAHGIVTIDLMLGRLVCENRSVELHFLSADERARALDERKTGGAGAGAAVGTSGAAGAGGAKGGETKSVNAACAELGVVGASAAASRPPDAPLQRPRRSLVRRVPPTDLQEVLRSHAVQIEAKADLAKAAHSAESAHLSSTIARLEAEAAAEAALRERRKALTRAQSVVHRQQAEQKAAREEAWHQGIATPKHFPFRTEEERIAHEKRTAEQQRANIEAQLKERQRARELLAGAPGVGAPDPLTLPMALPEPKPAPLPHAARPQTAMQAVFDDAYERYAAYLKARAQADGELTRTAEERAAAAEEAAQRRLEESRRRRAETDKILKGQVEHKQSTCAPRAPARSARPSLPARPSAKPTDPLPLLRPPLPPPPLPAATSSIRSTSARTSRRCASPRCPAPGRATVSSRPPPRRACGRRSRSRRVQSHRASCCSAAPSPAALPACPSPSSPGRPPRDPPARPGATLRRQAAAKVRAQAEAADTEGALEARIVQAASEQQAELERRRLALKAEEKAVLTVAWGRQQALKLLEKEVETLSSP